MSRAVARASWGVSACARGQPDWRGQRPGDTQMSRKFRWESGSTPVQRYRASFHRFAGQSCPHEGCERCERGCWGCAAIPPRVATRPVAAPARAGSLRDGHPAQRGRMRNPARAADLRTDDEACAPERRKDMTIPGAGVRRTAPSGATRTTPTMPRWAASGRTSSSSVAPERWWRCRRPRLTSTRPRSARPATPRRHSQVPPRC